jgi:hypothetical protein
MQQSLFRMKVVNTNLLRANERIQWYNRRSDRIQLRARGSKFYKEKMSHLQKIALHYPSSYQRGPVRVEYKKCGQNLDGKWVKNTVLQPFCVT